MMGVLPDESGVLDWFRPTASESRKFLHLDNPARPSQRL